jgi:hypothetical protein
LARQVALVLINQGSRQGDADLRPALDVLRRADVEML